MGRMWSGFVCARHRLRLEKRSTIYRGLVQAGVNAAPNAFVIPWVVKSVESWRSLANGGPVFINRQIECYDLFKPWLSFWQTIALYCDILLDWYIYVLYDLQSPCDSRALSLLFSRYFRHVKTYFLKSSASDFLRAPIRWPCTRDQLFNNLTCETDKFCIYTSCVNGYI